MGAARAAAWEMAVAAGWAYLAAVVEAAGLASTVAVKAAQMGRVIVQVVHLAAALETPMVVHPPQSRSSLWLRA